MIGAQHPRQGNRPAQPSTPDTRQAVSIVDPADVCDWNAKHRPSTWQAGVTPFCYRAASYQVQGGGRHHDVQSL
jgi:hypothetical protein